MAQKVQFITTVLHQPELLIFDEPFSGFDPVNAELLKNEILELRDKGATVIFSTHNMESVERLCNAIALIDKSKVVLSGEVDQIKNRYKQSIYHCSLVANNLSILPQYGEILEMQRNEQHIQARIKLSEQYNGNTLIEQLLHQGEVLRFEEVLPSMNDIFIETVTKQ